MSARARARTHGRAARERAARSRPSRSGSSRSTSTGRSIGHDFRISDRTAAAIREAMARGVRVSIATGRMASSAAVYAHQLGLTDPIIGHQGAVIRAMPAGRTAIDPADLAVPRAGRADPPPHADGRRRGARGDRLVPRARPRPARQRPRADRRLARRRPVRGLLGLPRAGGGHRGRPRGLDPQAGLEGHRGRGSAAADGADRGGAGGRSPGGPAPRSRTRGSSSSSRRGCRRAGRSRGWRSGPGSRWAR